MGRLILSLLIDGGLLQAGWLSVRTEGLQQTSIHQQTKNQTALVVISGKVVSS
jgi:hypothetical protein